MATTTRQMDLRKSLLERPFETLTQLRVVGHAYYKHASTSPMSIVHSSIQLIRGHVDKKLGHLRYRSRLGVMCIEHVTGEDRKKNVKRFKLYPSSDTMPKQLFAFLATKVCNLRVCTDCGFFALRLRSQTRKCANCLLGQADAIERRPLDPMQTCCICLATTDGQPCVLKCGHQFHMGCIQSWARQCDVSGISKSCPLCRRSIQ